ncbi:rod shape-determining protein MreD [Avibacterium avium]|uniref:rod shape-determining protein MreD n=1 Tax=Avibacterium avium TaxID=751 RepID=UPI003BF87884
MQGRLILQIFSVLLICLIAMVLEIIPWPASLHNFKPAWIILVLTYWVLVLPSKVNVGTAFVLGVAWDLVLGSVLGVHALVLSIYAYLLAKNHIMIRNLSLWMQGVVVILSVIAIRIGIFIIELFLHSADFNWQEAFGAIVSGILWPWMFLLLRRITRQLGIV